MKKPKNALIYARVSSKDQSDRGTSLDRQQEECEEYAAREDYKVIGVLREDVSGSVPFRERPKGAEAWQALIDGKVNAVIIQKVDRFSRNLDDGRTLALSRNKRRDGIVLTSTDTESSQGRLVLNLMLSIAEYERELIRDRTSGGHRKRWSEGRLAHGVPPFGIGFNTERNEWYAVEEEAAIVREVFELYAGGMSAQKIGDTLTDRGTPPPQNNGRPRKKDVLGRERWWASYVGRLLRSEVYHGVLVAYRGEFVVHNPKIDVSHLDGIKVVRKDFPVIIADPLWRRVQRARRRRTKNKLGPSTVGHAFTSRIICATCGLRFLGRKYRHEPSEHDGERRFGCRGAEQLAIRKGFIKERCPNTHKLWESELEDIVRRRVLADLEDPQRIAALVTNWLKELDVRIAELEADVLPAAKARRELEARCKRLARTFADGLTSEAEYEIELREINKAGLHLEEQTGDKGDRLAELEELQATRQQTVAIVEALRAMGSADYFEQMDDLQRDLIEAVMSVIRDLHLDPDGDIERLVQVLDLRVTIDGDGGVQVDGLLPLVISDNDSCCRCRPSPPPP